MQQFVLVPVELNSTFSKPVYYSFTSLYDDSREYSLFPPPSVIIDPVPDSLNSVPRLSSLHPLNNNSFLSLSLAEHRQHIKLEIFNICSPGIPSSRPVIFTFNEQILPHPAVYIDEFNHLNLLMVLSSGGVFRFAFPGPNYFGSFKSVDKPQTKKSSKSLDDIFDAEELPKFAFYQIKTVLSSQQRLSANSELTLKSLPVIVTSPDLDTVLVGCANGSLLLCEYSHKLDSEPLECDISELNYISTFRSIVSYTPRKFLSAFSSYSDANNANAESSPQQPISLTTAVIDDTLAFALCRDQKIRISSLIFKRVIKVVSLHTILSNPTSPEQPSEAVSSLLPNIIGPYLQVFRQSNSDGTFKIAAFIPSGNTIDTDPNTTSAFIKQSLQNLAVGDPLFIFFNGKIDGSNGSVTEFQPYLARACSFENNNEKEGFGVDDVLVDFKLFSTSSKRDDSVETDSNRVVYKLWTCWDRRKDSFVRITTVPEDSFSQVSARDKYLPESKAATPEDAMDLEIYGDRWLTVPTNSEDMVDLSDLEFYLQTQSSNELYLKYIFDESRFSFSVLQQAVIQYFTGLAMNEVMYNTWEGLREIVSGYIGSNITANDIPANGGIRTEDDETISIVSNTLRIQGGDMLASYAALQQEEWVRFLSLCVQLQSGANQAVGIHWDPTTNAVLLLTRGGLFFFRECTTIEILQAVADHRIDTGLFSMIPEKVFEVNQLTGVPDFLTSSLSHSQLISRQLRGDYVNGFAKIVAFIKENSTPADILTAELDLCQITLARAPPGKILHDLYSKDIADKYLYDILENPDLRKTLCGLIRGCSDVVHLVSKLLSIVKSVAFDDQSKETAVIPTWLRYSNSSNLIDTAISKSFIQISEANLQFIRNLVLVLSLIVAVESESGIPHVSSNLLAEALVVYQCAFVTSSLCKRTVVVGGNTKGSAEDEVVSGISKMSVSTNIRDSTDSSSQKRIISAPLFLMQNFYLLEIDFKTAPAFLNFPKLIRLATKILSQRLGIFSEVSKNLKSTNELDIAYWKASSIATISRTVLKLVRTLDLAAGRVSVPAISPTSITANILVEDLLNLVPKTAGSWYLLGRCYLKSSSFKKAKFAFEKASCGLKWRNSEDAEMLPAESTDDELWSGDDLMEKVIPAEIISGGIVAYYGHVMHLFSDRGCDEMVLVYARLALHSLIGVGSESSEPDANKIMSLRKTIFTHSLRMGAYEEAYVSMMSITDLKIKRSCAEVFIARLCEQHEFNRIISSQFPFTGLQSEVEKTLQTKASTGSVYPIPQREDSESKPNYYKILFAYYISRENYKNASLTMFQYGRRLAAIIPVVAAQLSKKASLGKNIKQLAPGSSLYDIIAEQGRSYLSALNALSLVNEDMRWLLHDESAMSKVPETIRKRRKVTSNLSSSVGNVEEISDEEKVVQEPSLANIQNTEIQTNVILLHDIRCEYKLAMAKLELSETFPHVLEMVASVANKQNENGMSTMDNIVILLVKINQFTVAIDIANLFAKPLDEIFTAYAARCIAIQTAEIDGRQVEELDWKIAGGTWDGTPSQCAWQNLRELLRKHDKAATGYSCHRAVAVKIMQTDLKSALPLWLVQFFKENEPEFLIREYMKCGLIDEATYFTISFLRFISESKITQTKTFGHWLPYTLLDKLLAVLRLQTQTDPGSESKDIDESTKYLFGKLRESMNAYVLKMREDGDVILKGGKLV
ncbi:hypothetical protein HK098_001466 [Nowakowskiella sp. JEL0407]|nr:hypothetical protein HK098_001466 [Nowakowskiella sp. JEL0407]